MSTITIPPALPSGFRDYLPAEAIARGRMIATIRAVFERYGFDPLETPAVERTDVLTGNDPRFRMIIYEAQTTAQRRAGEPIDTALRYDLTVPLARVVAANRSLPLPFKRYQMGNVWRGERPQAGRFREFLQCDADIVGTASPLADAEVIACIADVMRALGITQFTIRINNRKILNGLAEAAGFDVAQAADVLRVIDKLPKIGREAVLRELGKPQRTASAAEGDDASESESGCGLSVSAVERIGIFLALAGTTDALLDQMATFFVGSPVATEGVTELRSVIAALRAMGVPEEAFVLDPSIARGLSYYTGTVFETFLGELPSMGSVCSGGRYDDLVARFSDISVPAVGCSFGVDRLFAALTTLNRIAGATTATEVFVTIMDPEALPEYLAIAAELRRADIRTVLWLGTRMGFKEQLSYASERGIPIAVIVGSDERAAGTVVLRDLRTRQQEVVARDALVVAARRMLAGRDA
ncbi:histidine--tRNA ligase [Candidatus Uhrbacteria bacterium]|nr:histidine--tRNA ligase [Candidatus Uhrbacteria bacterium]